MTQYKDGVPCDHPGCLNHITHPCEGCGRIGGQSKEEEQNKIRNIMICPNPYHDCTDECPHFGEHAENKDCALECFLQGGPKKCDVVKEAEKK